MFHLNRHCIARPVLPVVAGRGVAALLLCLSAQPVLAQCSAKSPAYTVALLELYTSEGCSSCPPADKFVASLGAHPDLAQKVVPLALHVDYWDTIGWKDRFATRDYTERQRWLSGLARSKTIYTPEIFVSSRELRDWNTAGRLANTLQRINAKPAMADIVLRQRARTGNTASVDVEVRAPAGGNVFVALFENGLSSQVKAGENSGATLKHDYVVRDWIGPVTVPANAGQQRLALPRALALPADARQGRLGVAAFMQSAEGDVVQALSTPLCSN
ncbi:MAG: hypothetical protein JWR21_129 [Herminiimonas sp.]|nr:hypothetical protein [Herminiimonas sp.]MDB5854513.1 hypothetical protein [Herminiimonas sp.]